MGLFDMFKKKQATNAAADECEDLRNFERDLIQTVAITMFQLKIIKQPTLNFFNNDHGIFENIFISHTTDPRMLAIAGQNFTTYLMVMGCHALGTAAYVALCQTKYKKPLEEFGEKEICEIAQTIHETDAYEVALNALGYKLDGNNKRCLDHIVVTANNAAQSLAGEKIHDKRYQKIFMQVCYNAGVTLLYGR